MNATFTPKEAVRFGWETYKKQYGLILGIFIAGLLTIAVASIIQNIVKNVPVLSLLGHIFSWLVSSGITLGAIKVSLAFVDGKQPGVPDIFTCFHLVIPYLVASILYGLIVLGGLILLIVPGIIWFISYMFYPYFMVDKNRLFRDSLKSSASATKGHRGKLFLLMLILLGLNILGIITVVGVVITFPVSALSTAYVYRRLTAENLDQAAPMPQIIR